MTHSARSVAATSNAPRSLADCPTEVVDLVFDHLHDPRDVVSLAGTGRRFHAIARDRAGPVIDANARDVQSGLTAFMKDLADGLDRSSWLSSKWCTASFPDDTVREAGRWLASWWSSERQRCNAINTAPAIISRLTDEEVERIGKRLVGFGLPRLVASRDGGLQKAIATLSSDMKRMTPHTRNALLSQGSQSATEWQRNGSKRRDSERAWNLHLGFVACFDTLDAEQRDIAAHQLDGICRDYSGRGDHFIDPLLVRWSDLTQKQAIHLLRKLMQAALLARFDYCLVPKLASTLKHIVGTGDHRAILERVRDEALAHTTRIETGCLLGALLNQDGERGLQPMLAVIDLPNNKNRGMCLSILSYGSCLPPSIQDRILDAPLYEVCIPNIDRFDQRQAETLMTRAWAISERRDARDFGMYRPDLLMLCMPVLASLPAVHQTRWLNEFENMNHYGANSYILHRARYAASQWQGLAQPIRDGIAEAIVSQCGHPNSCLAASATISVLLPLLEQGSDTWQRAVSFLVQSGRAAWQMDDPDALPLMIRRNTVGLPVAERLRVLAAWDPPDPPATVKGEVKSAPSDMATNRAA